MLTAFKLFLRSIIPPIMFIGGIVVIILSFVKEALWGFYLLVFLIPQPNIWYKFHGYVLGKEFIDFLFAGILGGIFFPKKGI